jgi:hypothetical protein
MLSLLQLIILSRSILSGGGGGGGGGPGGAVCWGGPGVTVLWLRECLIPPLDLTLSLDQQRGKHS